MRILALPRGGNPYQRFLYEQFTRRGHRVRYVGDLTPSHTLNVLLLPLELAISRARGWDTLHIHWVFAFSLGGSDRWPALRRVSRAWFTLVLTIARALRLRVVWTAHNVLPHDQVFDDDMAARHRLVRRSELVVAHSQAALAELGLLGLVPRRAVVAPLGTCTPDVDASALAVPGAHASPRRMLFFGLVAEYKGVEELLQAFFRVPDSSPVRLVVAGECRDRPLRHRLLGLAAAQTNRVQLRLERLPEPELARQLSHADVVVLPYRRVTTSSSALLALGYGRPLLIPDLPTLAELPSDAVVRYDGSVNGLAEAISSLARCPPEQLAEMGRVGADYTRTLRWEDMATAMLDALGEG